MLNEELNLELVAEEATTEAVEEKNEIASEEIPTEKVEEDVQKELTNEEVEAIDAEVEEDAPHAIGDKLGKISTDASVGNVIDLSKVVAPIKKFEQYKKTGELLWCTVTSVMPLVDSCSVAVQVSYNGTSVVIPEKEYFEDSFSFGGNMSELDPEVQKKEIAFLKARRAKEQMGALVPVIITDFIESENKETETTTTTIFGSRKKGMALLREHYFGSGKPEIKQGDVASEAHVIAVAEDYAIVECLGVETRMDAYSLSYQNIHNCKKYFKAGDVLKNVTIRKIHVNNVDDAYLTLTARVYTDVQSATELQIGSSYLGTIDSYNANKHFYSIILDKSHLKVAVYNNSKNGFVYSDGTKVFVTISKIFPHFAVGFITGI